MVVLFQVHIKFKNAEPLIEKFNKDIFERYELINEVDTNNNHSRQFNRNNYSSPPQHQVRFKSPESSTSTHLTNDTNSYYYYDTVNRDLVNITDSIDNNSEFKTSKQTINLNNNNNYNNNGMMIDTVSSKIIYPLSFIDAVNKKQLDLENGLFRDPQGIIFGCFFLLFIKLF